MPSIAATLTILALATTLATSAAAVEPLTGTYVEKVRCKGIFNGVKQVVSAKDVEWFVDDLGDGNVYLHLSGSTWKYHGWLEEDTAHPDKGIIGFVACNPSDALPQGEFRVFDVKTSAGSGKATMKGIGLGIRSFGSQVCKHKFVRTSPTIPAVTSSCP